MRRSQLQSRRVRVLLYYSILITTLLLHHRYQYVVVEGLGNRKWNSRKPPSKDTNTKKDSQIAMLSKALRTIYNQGGTLGVLQQSRGMENYPAPLLVKAAVEASSGDNGMASGILNALLGSCCGDGGSVSGGGGKIKTGAKMAIDLIEAYDHPSIQLQPNLVALSLAFMATSQDPEFVNRADEFLDRAEQVYSSTTSSSSSSSVVKDKPDVDWSMLQQRHDIRLLQDTNEFVVVSKPSGMVCYHGAAASKPRRKQENRKSDLSLEECLQQHGVPLSTLNKEGRGLVHRIDRGTSGCLVLAKTNRMHAILIAHFFLRNVKKSYQALVCNPPSSSSSSSSHLNDQGSINLDIDGRPAKSTYYVEERFGDWVSRVKVYTEQGRRHQVRIHCAQGLKSPILLDPLYGGQAIMSSSKQFENMQSLRKLRAAKKFCLHADRLAVPEEGIDARAPLPDWWQQLENEIDSY